MRIIVLKVCGFGAVKTLSWPSRPGSVAEIQCGYRVLELLMSIVVILAPLVIQENWEISLKDNQLH